MIIDENIILDIEKSLSIEPENLYYWHYEVLQKIMKLILTFRA